MQGIRHSLTALLTANRDYERESNPIFFFFSQQKPRTLLNWVFLDVTEWNAFVSLRNNDNKILSENNLMNMVWDFPMSAPCDLWGGALKECSTLASQRGDVGWLLLLKALFPCFLSQTWFSQR